MTKIVVAIMLALSALGPANAASTTLPSQFLGQWCATYNESYQPGRITYSRDLKDCDRVLTIRSRGFADTNDSCDLITVRHLPEFRVYAASFKCNHASRKATVDFWMSLMSRGWLEMVSVIPKPPREPCPADRRESGGYCIR